MGENWGGPATKRFISQKYPWFLNFVVCRKGSYLWRLRFARRHQLNSLIARYVSSVVTATADVTAQMMMGYELATGLRLGVCTMVAWRSKSVRLETRPSVYEVVESSSVDILKSLRGYFCVSFKELLSAGSPWRLQWSATEDYKFRTSL